MVGPVCSQHVPSGLATFTQWLAFPVGTPLGSHHYNNATGTLATLLFRSDFGWHFLL